MKRLRVILLFLMLGAIVNVGVTWGIAAWDTPGSSLLWLPEITIVSGGMAGNPCWNVTCSRGTGWTSVKRYVGLFADDTPITPPSWSRAHISPSQIEISSGLAYVESAFGWPSNSMFYDIKYSNAGGFFGEIIGGIRFDFRIRDGTYIDSSTNLPFQPIFFGFAINTIFYAALLWLIIPGPCVFRRVIRRRRGLCIKCAYDLRGADHETCPECGTGIRKVRRARIASDSR